VRGDLSTDAAARPPAPVAQADERFHLLNPKVLQVHLGSDVLARQGAMIAYDGEMEFDPEHPTLLQAMRTWTSREAFPLMRVSGRGDCLFANFDADLLPFRLRREGIVVRARNVLALETTVDWDVRHVESAMAQFGGLACLELGGDGWVCLSTDGPPIVLRVDQAPTYVDPDAVIAWSAGLRVTVTERAVIQSVSDRDALLGRGSGEEVQVQFRGQGFVVVQPSEQG
jgi:uncharacterized protein (AIM24 family)